ncbi:MAG: hypothetical protein ABSH49_32470 [Bryobacteraceae bacterium]|jgi:hypothetical protein
MKSESSTVTRLMDVDSWCRIAIAFVRVRNRLEFAYLQTGAPESLSTSGFAVLPETFGPATAASSGLDIGYGRTQEPFGGLIAAVEFYDRANVALRSSALD